MKSFKHIFILCLITCAILSGRVYAQDKSDSNEEVIKKTMEPRVTYSFSREDLQMTLDQISEDTGINIMYADYVQGIVTCDIEDIRLSKALEMILAGTPYFFSKRDSYYVVTKQALVEKQLQIFGDTGLENVKMEGFPGEVLTDANGYYTAVVEAGFSGKIQPVKDGYKFNPSFVIYNNIDSDRKRQDYKSEIISLSQSPQKEKKEPYISKEYFDEDLQIVLDDLAADSGINILYEDTLSGLLTCRLEGVPLSKTIEMILSSTEYIVKKMDDYYLVTTPRLDDIKNKVASENNVIIGNIEMSLDSIVRFPCDIIPGPDGSYSITVPSGFVGTILPRKENSLSQNKEVYSDTPSYFANQDYDVNNGEIDEPIITYEYVNEDLLVILDMLSMDTGINIMYPDSITGLITCKLNETPLSKALEIILAATPYSVKKMDGYYLVHAQGFPMEKLLSGKENKDEAEPKVTQEFIEDDLLLVLDQLSEDSGVNIINAANVQGAVTCKFEDISLSKALRMILAPTPYIARKRDGYYVITEYLSKNKQYEISGNVGIANVKMEGLPGEIYTDANGYYHANVEPGFSGKIQPVEDGYNFNPSYIVYNNLRSNRIKQDYKSNIVFSSQAGPKELDVPNVSESFYQDDLWIVLDILKKETGTNIILDDAIHGIVSCNLNNVSLGKALEIIFSATPYIIKKMDGYYLIISPWLDDIKNRVTSNKITNTVKGNIIRDYGFSEIINHVNEESSLSFPEYQGSIEKEDSTNKNDNSQKQMLTISDTLEINGIAFSGVNITASPGDIKTVTDSKGHYSIEVPYGWSGKITLSKPGFKFEPESKSFKNVTTDFRDGEPVLPAD